MSYKYAVLNDDGTAVIEYRTYPTPLEASAIKRLATGLLKVRPVVTNLLPFTDMQRSTETVTIEAERVVISNTVEDLPEADRKALHNKKINDQIVAIESRQARAVREAALGSPAYLITIEQEIADLRAQRL